jgi:hypothetical protein
VISYTPDDYRKAAEILRALPEIMRETLTVRGISVRSAAGQVGCSHMSLYRMRVAEGATRRQQLILALEWLAYGEATDG